MLNIIDVSHHNNKEKITEKVLEYDGMMIKATEGRTYIDNTMTYWASFAERRHMPMGFYHYARPENNTAEREADNFVATIRPWLGKVVLALDWEGRALEYPTKWAIDWCEEVFGMTSVKPMVYCSESVAKNLAKDFIHYDYGLWVANWSKKPNQISRRINGWLVAMHQYTSEPWDKNMFFGTREQWNKYTELLSGAIDYPGKCYCGCKYCCEVTGEDNGNLG